MGYVLRAASIHTSGYESPPELLVARVQASIREKSSLNRPSHTSVCAPPLRDLVGAALVVRTG